MGSGQSAEEYFNKPLVPQRHFVGNMSQRFVRPRVVTLELEDEFWNKQRDTEIEIRDLASDQIMFRLPATESEDPTKKMLLDAFRVPVVRMGSRKDGPRGALHAVYPGGPSATTLFCEFRTEMTVFEKPLAFEFVDRLTGQQVRMGVTGKWLNRTAMIWIESGQWGARYPIGRIYRKPGTAAGRFLVDIAPGVDVSLIVLACAAMEEESNKHDINKGRRAKHTAKKAAKAAKAEAKAGKMAAKA